MDARLPPRRRRLAPPAQLDRGVLATAARLRPTPRRCWSGSGPSGTTAPATSGGAGASTVRDRYRPVRPVARARLPRHVGKRPLPVPVRAGCRAARQSRRLPRVVPGDGGAGRARRPGSRLAAARRGAAPVRRRDGSDARSERSKARAEPSSRPRADSAASRLARRALTAWLHLLQPLARLRGRLGYGLTPWRRRGSGSPAAPWPVATALWRERWESPTATLAQLSRRLAATGAIVRSGGDFDRWDLEAWVGTLGAARLLVAIEEHGSGRQLVRLRAWPRGRPGWLAFGVGLALLAAGAAATGAVVAAALLAAAALGVIVRVALDCGERARRVRDALRPADVVAPCGRGPCPPRSTRRPSGPRSHVAAIPAAPVPRSPSPRRRRGPGDDRPRRRSRGAPTLAGEAPRRSRPGPAADVRGRREPSTVAARRRPVPTACSRGSRWGRS